MSQETINRNNINPFNDILDFFPILKDADNVLRQEFANTAILQSFPPKKILYTEGDKCNFLGLVTSGTVRVYKTGENKNEITLYRVGKGECCFLTASCLMEGTSFPAIAEVEEQLEVALVPSLVLQEWVKNHELWRKYLFSLMGNRLSKIAATVDEVAFQKTDRRIANLLFKKHKNSLVQITHQEIAEELGTAREVISRILKEFEKQGILTLERGYILVSNIELLRLKSEGDDNK